MQQAVRDKCRKRRWRCFAVTARSNHVHAVVAAKSMDPVSVRDQLKAMATTRLRQMDRRYQGRDIWTAKGDVQWLRDEAELEQAVLYVEFAQDRKGRDDEGEKSIQVR